MGVLKGRLFFDPLGRYIQSLYILWRRYLRSTPRSSNNFWATNFGGRKKGVGRDLKFVAQKIEAWKLEVPAFGGPRTKTRFGKLPKMAEGHWEKLRYRAVYAGIRKTPLGKTTEILVVSRPFVTFFTWVAPMGPFWPFFGPRGVQGQSENANLAATRKPQIKWVQPS